MTDELAVKLAETEARSKSNSHRLDEVERRQDDMDELVTSVALLAQRQETVETDVKEIKADVKALTEKPGKRWDGLVEKALWALAAAVIAFFLGRMGMA